MSQQNLFENQQSSGEIDVESQTKQILKFLQSGRVLTSLDALKKFNCMRLGARIYDLRMKGVPITTNMVMVGKNKKRIAVYKYEQEKPTNS